MNDLGAPLAHRQVNNVDVTRLECNQVVPLLSTSPDELVLVVGRRPAPMFDETDEFYHMDQDGDDVEHRSTWTKTNEKNQPFLPSTSSSI